GLPPLQDVVEMFREARSAWECRRSGAAHDGRARTLSAGTKPLSCPDAEKHTHCLPGTGMRRAQGSATRGIMVAGRVRVACTGKPVMETTSARRLARASIASPIK